MKINFRAERKAARLGRIYELGHKFNRRESLAKYGFNKEAECQLCDWEKLIFSNKI